MLHHMTEIEKALLEAQFGVQQLHDDEIDKVEVDFKCDLPSYPTVRQAQGA